MNDDDVEYAVADSLDPRRAALRRRFNEIYRSMPLEEANAEVANDPALVRELKLWNAEDTTLPEGPDPEGIANRLRRERDEARAERDQAEARLSQAEARAKALWPIISECAKALQMPRGGTLTLSVEVAQKLYARYVEATGDYEDLPNWFVLPPED